MDEWTPDLLKQHLDAIFTERLRIQQDNDAALHRRIDEQITSLREATVAQEKRVDAAFKASETAITKADHAYEKRFEDANEWRGQSADRERTQQQEIQDFRATLLPRETFDSFLSQWDNWRETVNERLTARDAQSKGAEQTLKWLGWGIGMFSTVVAILSTTGHI